MNINKRKLTIGIAGISTVIFAVELFTADAVKNILNARHVASGCACASGAAMNFLSWFTVGIAGVFAAGLIVALVYLLATYIRTRKMSLNIQKQEQSALDGTKFYLQDGDCCGAFTLGFLSPRIAVCRHCVNILPSGEISAMLRHEEYHVKRRDPLRFLMLDILKRVYFFVPVLRPLISAYHTATEIEADKTVSDRENLGRALLHVSYTPEVLDGRAAFASAIHERIERIINPQWKMKLLIPKSFILVSGAMLFSMMLLISRPPAQMRQNYSRCTRMAVARSCTPAPTYGTTPLIPLQF